MSLLGVSDGRNHQTKNFKTTSYLLHLPSKLGLISICSLAKGHSKKSAPMSKNSFRLVSTTYLTALLHYIVQKSWVRIILLDLLGLQIVCISFTIA